MAHSPTAPKTQSRLPVVQKLITTLEQEYDALSILADQLDEQLDILRQKDLGELDACTHRTSETVAKLDSLSQARRRQMRLAGRMLNVGDAPTLDQLADAARQQEGADEAARRLLDLRTQMHDQAEYVQRRSEELEQALQYAASLGRKMISFLRGGDNAPPARVYTSKGQSSTPDTQSLLNQVG